MRKWGLCEETEGHCGTIFDYCARKQLGDCGKVRVRGEWGHKMV